MEQIHATCVDVEGYGVVLLGSPGAGKSDLALRLIDGDERNRLVADDRVDMTARSGRLIASPPDAIAGKLEVRGIGIVAVEYLPETWVRLAVDLVARDAVERLPEDQTWACLGVTLPLVSLHAFDASAPAKVRLAVARAAPILSAL